jgi:IS5 family transposase
VQQSFSSLEFASKKKLTRRERLLREIDAIAPWSDLMARIEPHYPKGEGRGRPPIGLARMLRMYVVQQCLGLSDEGIEDAVYDNSPPRARSISAFFNAMVVALICPAVIGARLYGTG